MHKIVLHQIGKYWYWYLLPEDRKFMAFTAQGFPTGYDTSIRKALVKGRERAEELGYTISHIHMERNP